MTRCLPHGRTRGLRWLAHAVLATAVAGCAAVKVPPLQPPLPDHWRHSTVGSGAAVPTDLHHWWHAFGDRQLDALVDQALAGNLDVAQALEHVRAARAMHKASEARFRPQLRATTIDAIDPDASASFFVAGFDASWELNLFGRGQATQRLARADVATADADLRAARLSLVGEVVRDWIDLRAAQQQLGVLRTIRDARRQEYALLQVRQRLKLAGLDEVERARAALDQAESALVEPGEAVDASAQQLAVLLGRPEPDTDWLQPHPLPSLGDWRAGAVPADLLRARPDILRAEAEVLRAAGEAGLAHANRFPSLALGGSLVWSTNLQTHRRTNDNALFSTGPIIDIPLFDWGMRAAQDHARRHELQASVLAYRQSVLQAVAATETALGGLQARTDDERRCADALAALTHADAVVARRVDLKLASPLDREESRIARGQAAQASIQARARRDLAFVALFKALGGAPPPATELAARPEHRD
ncbi:MAG TPA: efflux transporter outer membrane subunit [Frateuria sp.]|uniref:efflux transporter outer membrane subunit n=1 Tax=Frateuria sp. TaxID=2211372 RepID=UPI002D7F7C32|nr:efflux transporter outer membrane subunit [Frateuria sp.]HET6803950.1 efflux transporter outer membrane subunit [Frateuria sp.]